MKRVANGELKSQPRNRETIQLTNEPREQRLGARPRSRKELRVGRSEVDPQWARARARLTAMKRAEFRSDAAILSDFLPADGSPVNNPVAKGCEPLER